MSSPACTSSPASRRHLRWLLGVALALVGVLAAPATAPAAVTTKTFKVGPISVGGYEVKQSFASAPHGGLPDGHITRMEVDIVDADGTPVPIQRLMLHHIVFINLYRQDTTCQSFTNFDSRTQLPGRQRFYAAGEERAKLLMPPGYGYRHSASEQWALTYMVMNHRATADQAYIQYTVTVDDDPLVKDVTPYWLDVKNCLADPIYNVPGNRKVGSVHRRTWDFRLPEAGRIVAGGGHVHGGARRLAVTEPDCGNREIAQSDPTWGFADHPFYNVRPVLHEPGPVNMSGFTTPTGIPVASGERLRLNSVYDNSEPHVRVMGIFMVYLAPDPTVVDRCGPLPGDISVYRGAEGRRRELIRFGIPLTGLDENGQAVTIKKPPGPTVRLGEGADIEVGDRFFEKPNVVVRRGTKLDWIFGGGELHNLTLANGPIGIGSPNLDRDRVFSYRFRKAGTYRFFCGLHPVQMHERVVVRRPRDRRR